MKHLSLAAIAAILLLAVPSAHAQGTIGAGVHGLYDLDLESFGIGAQARAGANLGGFSLVINPSLEYFFTDDEENVSTSAFGANVDLLYQIGDQYVTTFQPYFGAGLGIRRYSVEVDSPLGDLDGSETDLGLNLIGGATFGGGPIQPFARATIAIMDGTPIVLKAGILFGI